MNLQLDRLSGTVGGTIGFGRVRGGVLAPMARRNSVRNSSLGVSAEPQKSPGRIGGTPKVLSKEMASDSRGADRRLRRIKGNSLVQEEKVHLAQREAFRFLCTILMIPLDSGW